jgi:hypothetical protein
MKGDDEKWLDLFFLFIAGNPQKLLTPIHYSCRLEALGKICWWIYARNQNKWLRLDERAPSLQI